MRKKWFKETFFTHSYTFGTLIFSFSFFFFPVVHPYHIRKNEARQGKRKKYCSHRTIKEPIWKTVSCQSSRLFEFSAILFTPWRGRLFLIQSKLLSLHLYFVVFSCENCGWPVKIPRLPHFHLYCRFCYNEQKRWEVSLLKEQKHEVIIQGELNTAKIEKEHIDAMCRSLLRDVLQYHSNQNKIESNQAGFLTNSVESCKR